MKFYEVITNAYANEALARNDYLHTLWLFVKVKWQTDLIVPYVRGSIHCAIQQLSLLVLDFTAYTRHFIHTQR
jgi:hypothetical protein